MRVRRETSFSRSLPPACVWPCLPARFHAHTCLTPSRHLRSAGRRRSARRWSACATCRRRSAGRGRPRTPSRRAREATQSARGRPENETARNNTPLASDPTAPRLNRSSSRRRRASTTLCRSTTTRGRSSRRRPTTSSAPWCASLEGNTGKLQGRFCASAVLAKCVTRHSAASHAFLQLALCSANRGGGACAADR